MRNQKRLSIFSSVVEAYAEAGSRPLHNEELYARVSAKAGIPERTLKERRPIGVSQAMSSPLTRTARWTQQTLKARGLLSRVAGQRGVWELTGEGRRKLHRLERGRVLIGFSTRLGVALVGDCRDAMASIDEPIVLALCSPPYSLAKPRRYGNCKPEEYVDFICSCMEPVIKRLAPGASVVLNIGNEVFIAGTPARTLLPEMLTIQLCARFSLFKMDNVVWHCPNKAPGPVAWASKTRVQLHAGYEWCIWLTNDPMKVRSNNQAVLRPHSRRHARLQAGGGERREGIYSDGAYRLHVGSFGGVTAGAIPRNVLTLGHNCKDQRDYKAATAALGLPVHGAPFPVSLASFFISFLSTERDLVVDPFGGTMTTGVAAEALGRRWIASDLMAEYVRGAATRFAQTIEWINPELDQLFGIGSGKAG
ncbi:MAG: site-specific DNA-methyltransferase [Rhizobium sp.]|nr:MAG: site-specific DNA-methyltransferase [Rhizobium sp.]